MVFLRRRELDLERDRERLECDRERLERDTERLERDEECDKEGERRWRDREVDGERERDTERDRERERWRCEERYRLLDLSAKNNYYIRTPDVFVLTCFRIKLLLHPHGQA